MRLEQFFKSKGYGIDDRLDMDSYIDEFKQWYKGNIPSFQNYTIYNGDAKIQCRRKTLNMAKKVCEDFANLLMNEKVSFNIGNKTTQKLIDPILKDNDFELLANEGVEKSFALGTGAFVMSLGDLIYDAEKEIIDTGEATVKIEFATADKIYPLSYDKNKITECAFAVRRVLNGTAVLYVSIHRKAKETDIGIQTGNYIIENYLFKIAKGGNLIDMSDKLITTIRVIDTGADIPWFAILKPRITNNIFLDNPMGISVYANSIDVLKGIDIAYDSLLNEFILGRKRIFVEEDLLKVDGSTGEMKKIFDANDTVFYSLPGTDDNTAGKKITESDMNLRVEEHEKGIQENLNLLSTKIGFGQNGYSFDKGSVQTATQIISENSDLYRTIKKHEIAIEDCMIDVFRAILSMMNNYLGISVSPDVDITIDFDDSIIEDTGETRKQAQLEYNLGLIDEVMYFMMTRKLDEKQAKKLVEEIKERMPQEETTVEGNEE